mgnify:CR=1 FL=1|jgi:hypothetical protein
MCTLTVSANVLVRRLREADGLSFGNPLYSVRLAHVDSDAPRMRHFFASAHRPRCSALCVLRAFIRSYLQLAEHDSPRVCSKLLHTLLPIFFSG